MINEKVFLKIKQLLESEEIEYKLNIHEPVRTSEEAAAIRGEDLNTGAKALVIKLEEGRFALFVLPANKHLDWKKIKEILGVKKPRMATKEEAERLTQCKVGGVPPFGNVMNLETFFDTEIPQIPRVNFNAGLKTHSINIKSSDLIKIVNPQIVDLTK